MTGNRSGVVSVARLATAWVGTFLASGQVGMHYGWRHLLPWHRISGRFYADQAFIEDPLRHSILQCDIAILGDRLSDGHQHAIDIHQDALDWVFMHFMASDNIVPVKSEVYASADPASVIQEVILSGFPIISRLLTPASASATMGWLRHSVSGGHRHPLSWYSTA